MNSNCKKRSKVTRTAVIPAEKEDRLGDLPDEIICRILSFLPTRDAFRTSILNSRWKDVYLGVPDIESAIATKSFLFKAHGMIVSMEAEMREIKNEMKVLEKRYDTLADNIIKYMLLRRSEAQDGEDKRGGESGEDGETGSEEGQDGGDRDAYGDTASEDTCDEEGDSEDSETG